jgi:hypothetical protein
MTTTMNRRHALKTAAAVALTPPSLAALPNPATAGAPEHTAPFAELAADAGDSYDLTVWLRVDLIRYPGGVVDADMQNTHRVYAIEAGRRASGAHLRVSPWIGSLDASDDEDAGAVGDPLLERHDPTGAFDPLTALRALLGGHAA